MRRRGGAVAARVLAALLGGGLAAGPAVARAGDPDAAARGRMIYREGRSPRGGSIRAEVGGTVLPGGAVPCAGCHGRDGRGRPEGGVTPPEIGWTTLTKPYGHAHPDGRRHPAFDARTAARAVTEGIDPAGNRLGPAMPRYAMSNSDLGDLIAYLGRLEGEAAPGVSADAIRIATVVPEGGPLAALGADLRALLEAEVAAIDGAGGIHGRRLALEVVAYGPGEDAAARLEAVHRRDPVHVLIGGVLPGAEARVAALAAREELPWLGPPTHRDLAEGEGWVFRPAAGLNEEARVLVRHAATVLGPRERRGVALGPADAGNEAAVRAARTEAGRTGLRLDARELSIGPFDETIVDRLRADRTGFVLFLGRDDELRGFLARAAAIGFAPLLLVPGTGAVRAAATAPEPLAARVRLAFPTVPADHAPRAVAALAGRSPAFRDGRHRPALIDLHAAMAVLEEGLRCAGRGLDRGRLVACLEGLAGLETGLLPPIAFGPGRRVGTGGAYVVAPVPGGGSFRQVGDFVRLGDDATSGRAVDGKGDGRPRSQ